MKFEWDQTKRDLNIEKHGLDFVDVARIWERPMLVAEDCRQNYGERRFVGIGRLESHHVVVVFTFRARDVIRIISLRKANKREMTYYEQAK